MTLRTRLEKLEAESQRKKPGGMTPEQIRDLSEKIRPIHLAYLAGLPPPPDTDPELVRIVHHLDESI